jgi:hypothetical protein
MPARRSNLARAMLLIALLGLVVAFLTSDGQRYLRASHRIGMALCSLPDRRPPEIPPRAWNNALASPSIACVNVFVPGQVRLDELERFNAELEQKLQGEVGLETLDWIMDRLERTRAEPGSRDGVRRYLVRMRQHYALDLRGLRSGSPSPAGASATAAPRQPAVGASK